jgi:hypothetical protein|tara:strand:- start:1612 stop:1887 length:276 start_codon:yes stop_codon:yes gene_type:complete
MRKVSGVYIPTPPRGASHFVLEAKNESCCSPNRKAVVAIADVDALIGTKGKLKFVKAHRGKILKEFKPTYTWNGKCIKELEKEVKIKESEA